MKPLVSVVCRADRYLIEETMLLAVSAYWPVGASFRYVSKCGFASAVLPAFTNAMPSQ